MTSGSLSQPKTTTIKHAVLKSVAITSQLPGQLEKLMHKHSTTRFQLQKAAQAVLSKMDAQGNITAGDQAGHHKSHHTRDQQHKEQRAQVEFHRFQQL